MNIITIIYKKWQKEVTRKGESDRERDRERVRGRETGRQRERVKNNERK